MWLELFLTDKSNPQLVETHFVYPYGKAELVKRAARGLDEGAHSADYGSFGWTRGVQALTVFLLRWAAWGGASKTDKNVPQPLIQGKRRSLAATLNDVLTKKPRWLKEMFGWDASGEPHIGFIKRSNPDFKTIPDGPVVLSLDVNQLLPTYIFITVGDARVEDSKVIGAMADRIESRYYRSVGSSEEILDLTDVSSKNLDDREGVNVLETYAENLIKDIYNNLVIELVDKPYFEDICIAPLVRMLNDPCAFTTVHEMSSLVDASRSVIVSAPGSGKTHALRKLALDLLRQDPMRVIPIYISLSSFAGRTERNSLYTFEKHINDELQILGCQSIDVISQIRDRLILLLLDGWDEMWSEEARREVKRYLAQTQHHCIVATRPESLRTLPFRDRYVMEPLSLSRMREFIRLRIIREDRVDELINWIKSNPSILRLAANPLNLSIIGIVFEEEGSVPNLTKTKLYVRAFDVIMRQHYKANPYEGFTVNGTDITSKVMSLLQHLAYETLLSSHGRFFDLEQLHKVANEVLGFVPINLSSDLAGRLGIIRDRRSSRFEFFHPWYQEFLTAKHIKESSDTVDEMVKNLDKRQFASSLPYVVGLISSTVDALHLMAKVTIHDPSNYCRAISEGEFSEVDTRELLLTVIRWAQQCSPEISVRLELSRALAETGLSALSALYPIARDVNLSDYSRRAALEAVALVEPDQGELDGLLLELLPDCSGGLLWHVMEHIGTRRISADRELLQTYACGSDPITAGDSIWALKQLGVRPITEISSDLVDGLCKCLVSDDDHVQGHALRTTGRLKIREVVPILLEHIRRKDAKYRWIVPQAASLIGGKDAVNLLNEALFDKDKRVVASAIRGVGELQEVLPQNTIERIRYYENDYTTLEFFDETLGSLARSTLAKLKRKGMPGKLARLFIVRHCKTKWNLDGKLQGKRDLPLCAAGISEARENIAKIKNLGISRIYCSNTRRARETAEIYAKHIGVPVHTSPRLREIDHGDWEGYSIKNLLANKPSGYVEWMKGPVAFDIPGSTESITSAQQRILEEVRDIAQSFRDETVLIVSHKHIIATLMCALRKVPLKEFSRMIDEYVFPRSLSSVAMTDICREVNGSCTEAEST